MTFTESIYTCFSKYATFSGRASRPEYWWFALFLYAGSLALRIAFGFNASGPSTLQIVFGLGTLLPGLAVAVRRLHDTNRSGAYLFIGLIPIVGIFVILWMLTNPGSPGPNTYGETPDYPINDLDTDPTTDPSDPQPYR
ncbi:inner membrane protein YhaI [bacterium BMS3Bbin02]|nr:inner membrane protein YhaI [bacterium BMS3Bbin02]